MRQPHRNRQGFTLIELIVVLAVTGILAAMAVSAPKVHVTLPPSGEPGIFDVRSGSDLLSLD